MLDLAAKLNLKSAIVKWASRDGEELRGNDRLWKETGGAFLTLLEYERGAVWMRDWKERATGVDTAALLWVAALNDGCRNNKLSPKKVAEDARVEGLRRFPDSSNSSLFRAGLAFRAAVDGRRAEAKAWLQDFEPETTPDYYANYGKLARSVVAAADGDEESAKSNLRQAVCFFAGVNENAAKTLAGEAVHAVAARIPSARGSVRRLRKQWGLPALGKVKATARRAPEVQSFGAPAIFATVFVLINLLRACSQE